MTDQPIITEALRVYARQQAERHRASANYNISQARQCHRKEYLARQLGMAAVNGIAPPIVVENRKLLPFPPDDNSLFKMNTGILNEEYRVNPAIDATDLRAGQSGLQVYLKIDDYGYSGKIDRIVGLPDDPHLLEIKFTQAESFRYAKKEDCKWIRDDYLWQMLTYYWFRDCITDDVWREKLADCKKCRLFVGAMDRRLQQEVLIYPDERRVLYWEATGGMVEVRLPDRFTKEAITEWMDDSRAYWDKQLLPPALKEETQFPCESRSSYCSFVPYCFARLPGKVYRGMLPLDKKEYQGKLSGQEPCQRVKPPAKGDQNA